VNKDADVYVFSSPSSHAAHLSFIYSMRIMARIRNNEKIESLPDIHTLRGDDNEVGVAGMLLLVGKKNRIKRCRVVHIIGNDNTVELEENAYVIGDGNALFTMATTLITIVGNNNIVIAPNSFVYVRGKDNRIQARTRTLLITHGSTASVPSTTTPIVIPLRHVAAPPASSPPASVPVLTLSTQLPPPSTEVKEETRLENKKTIDIPTSTTKLPEFSIVRHRRQSLLRDATIPDIDCVRYVREVNLQFEYGVTYKIKDLPPSELLPTLPDCEIAFIEQPAGTLRVISCTRAISKLLNIYPSTMTRYANKFPSSYVIAKSDAPQWKLPLAWGGRGFRRPYRVIADLNTLRRFVQFLVSQSRPSGDDSAHDLDFVDAEIVNEPDDVANSLKRTRIKLRDDDDYEEDDDDSSESRRKYTRTDTTD
jgi:hypothetical protein